jgi:alkylresorcinol/alkylpyrone synthase
MPHILSTATAIPPHRLDQTYARNGMAHLCRDHPHLTRLVSVFDRSGVESRHLIHPPDWYVEERTWEERNHEYAARGLELMEQAVRTCLERASTAPDEIDHLFFVTTTGLATPSLDALLAARLGMRLDVRRSPLFGLGCAGGAGALVRACDVLRQAPGERALVISLEICSLVFSTRAKTATDVVGVALFGDGAAAVLLGGDDHAADESVTVAQTATRLFPEAQHLMGWNFTGDGMRLILSRDVPTFVTERLAPVVREFVGGAGTAVDALDHYLLHPGGPKVMDTYCSTFGLPGEAVSISRESMREYGNLSSAAVLFMLNDLVTSGRPKAGDAGLMIALGPGFACEMLMLRW